MPSSYITFVDVNRDRARFYARAKDANFRRTETLSHRFGDLAQTRIVLAKKKNVSFANGSPHELPPISSLDLLFRSLNREVEIKNLLQQFAFFLRPLDLLLEVNSGRGGNDQTLGFMHRAANRLNRLVVLVIQGIDNAKNRAQFADDLLIAWTYLARKLRPGNRWERIWPRVR